MSAREFSVCYSPNALPERRATEVDEQPERQIEQTEISENLLAVQRCNSLHGFEFDEKPPLDPQVGAKPFGQLKAIVAARYRLQIRSASRRDRGWQYVKISWVAVQFNNKQQKQ